MTRSRALATLALGGLLLSRAEPAQAGSVPAWTTLASDACGVVTASARVKASGKPRVVLITSLDGSAEPLSVDVPAGADQISARMFVGAARSVDLTLHDGKRASPAGHVDLPPWDAAFAVTVPPAIHAGEVSPPFTVIAITPCDLHGRVTLGVRYADGSITRAPLDATERATFTLPNAVQGDGSVDIELRDGDAILHTEVVRFRAGPPCVDQDRDGHLWCQDDCDDTRADVHAGAVDVKGDGVDNDCDGTNGLDADHDGFEAKSVKGNDCDDRDALVHPGAASYPDHDGDHAYPEGPIDFDCDGTLDDRPEGSSEDCNDHDATVPRAEEATPNALDDDCDGLIDEGTVAFDDDGDGWTELRGDCNDGQRKAFPGAREAADCIDNDCDGQTDEGLIRPEKDDAYEPNDERPFALPNPEGHRNMLLFLSYSSTAQQLKLVTRDGADVERFTQLTDDGHFDAWDFAASVTSLPDHASYTLIVDGNGRHEERTIDASGQGISLYGTPVNDDGGVYTVELRPLSVPLPWCPVELYVHGG